ncbi:uncharacterized protein AB675_2207 [Cyphellophora attinorum]|uniref:Uncharacterized protein n=1 Tax=Cyphellophora attinorum TaxID=1664694 RepID=A0A0N0NPH0_9EURO|nr:uncharacterized protein AB675_2207 [Phialophora attinorum]KPI42741.1 hypothetical protein AB675_2207 [Phialophora attinorum]
MPWFNGIIALDEQYGPAQPQPERMAIGCGMASHTTWQMLVVPKTISLERQGVQEGTFSSSTLRPDETYDAQRLQQTTSPQRQQPNSTSSQIQRPPSADSSGVHTLRRTPKLHDRPEYREQLQAPRQLRTAGQAVTFDGSGSTSPQDFQRLVQGDTYWPARSTHISRRTHNAILFALEAIRTGRGVDAKPLTEDLLEERARMSDLVAGSQPSGRPQNGGASRTAQSAGPVPTEPPRYRTPTDVMRDRRAREQRKAEQQEADRLRQAQEEQLRLQQEQSAGVEGPLGSRMSSTRPDVQGYTIGGTPSAQPGPSSTRRRDPVPVPQQTRLPIAEPLSQAQLQPQTGYAPGHARLSSNTQRNRTEAYDTLNIPATARPTQQQQAPPQPQPKAPQSNPQPTAPAGGQPKAAFPHAFERWETLSSHWEGLTSYWIRRLQENTNELNGKPLDQQLSRQITDLSAAGANLFHAVVELQRLRASSERKFQKWFFETRNEQEQAAERQAELERQLRAEREARTKLEATGPAVSAEAIRAEKAKAEEMVREMRRELTISKEEARRAWEELGRREQEERDRTIALRSGEPTLIGGVQVVPMQGIASRQVSSAQRPQTRDGTYPGGPTATLMGGLQPPQQPPSRSQTTTTSLDSPGEEHRQFTFQPQVASPDPFNEGMQPAAGGEHQLRHEPDTRFYPTSSQPPTSSAAMAAAAQVPTTNGGSHFYQQPSAPQTSIHQPLPPIGQTAQPSRTAGPPSTRSYIPSVTGSSVGEEEYHINPDGSYTLDSRGRRIPYNQPIMDSPVIGEVSPPRRTRPSEVDIQSDDDESYTSDIARERMYAQQYGTGAAQASSSPARPPIPQNQPPRETLQTTSGNIPRTSAPSALPPIPQGRVVAPTSSEQPQQQSPADYEGGGYGGTWEAPSINYHPTRLSDIIEEPRTSPSRTSYVSGSTGGPPPR